MNGNTMKKKWMSLLLVAVMVLTTLGVATLGSAAYAAENEIEITVTVSNAGELAKDAEGNVAANLPVTVPADANGTATVDAALKALHEAYCPGGYATSESAYGLGLVVQKLWGVENGGSYLFAINSVGCSSGVGGDYVGNGDHLTAVVMKDMVYWSDLIASFDKTAVTAKAGEQVELTLTYDAVTYDADWNATHAATPVTGADVSVAGEVVATTDASGKASISFDEAGTYVVTASGAVKMQVQDWSQGGAYVEADAPISAPACVVTIENPAEQEEATETHKIKKPAGKYEQGSEEGWSFRGNGAYEDFVEIKVDGKTVDKKHYTVEEGSTIVTLHAAYLDTLSSGEHTLEMVWTTGSAETTFEVAEARKTEEKDADPNEEKDADPNEEMDADPNEEKVTGNIQEEEGTDNKDEKAPATGDAAQMALYLMLLIGAASTAYVTKKQK